MLGFTLPGPSWFEWRKNALPQSTFPQQFPLVHFIGHLIYFNPCPIEASDKAIKAAVPLSLLLDSAWGSISVGGDSSFTKKIKEKKNDCGYNTRSETK